MKPVDFHETSKKIIMHHQGNICAGSHLYQQALMLRLLCTQQENPHPERHL
jgi:hypothetical protein